MVIYKSLEDISKITESIINNNVGIFPSKNGYMLISLPENSDKIRKIKNKSNRKCLVHIFSNLNMLENCIDNSKISIKIKLFLDYMQFLPTITIVNSATFSEYHDSLETLGIYFAHSNIWEYSLSNLLQAPFVASSANISGGETPFTIGEISKEIIDQVDFVFDVSNLPERSDFTVFDVSQNIFLREGDEHIKNQIQYLSKFLL